MALCDYRLCDVCNCKVFYDADLADDYTDHIGAWVVLCHDCAKTRKVLCVEREATADTRASVLSEVGREVDNLLPALADDEYRTGYAEACADVLALLKRLEKGK